MDNFEDQSHSQDYGYDHEHDQNCKHDDHRSADSLPGLIGRKIGEIMQNVMSRLLPLQALRKLSEAGAPEQTKKVCVNLIVQKDEKFYCYSCDKEITKTYTQDSLKNLVVVPKSLEKEALKCECQAPLLVNIFEGSNSETYSRKVKISDTHIEAMRTKKTWLETLMYPATLVLPSSSVLLQIECIEGTYYLRFEKPHSWFSSSSSSQKTPQQKILKSLELKLQLLDPSKKAAEVRNQLQKVIGYIPSHSDDLGITFEGIDKLKLSEFKSFCFLDIDGTSTNSVLKNKDPLIPKLSQYLFRYLSVLEARKLMKTVINSGRPIEDLFFMMKDFNLLPLAIASNGNGVCYPRVYPYSNVTGVHHQKSQFKDLLRSILQIVRSKYHLPLSEFLPLTSANTQLVLNPYFSPNPRDLEDLIHSDPTVNYLLGKTSQKVIATQGESTMIHLSTSNYTKGQTAAKLLKSLGVQVDKSLNVGNHLNDITLASKVGWSASVSNGQDEYKAVCSYVSPYQEAKGTIDSINRYLLQKNLTTEDQLKSIHQEVKSSFLKEIEEYDFDQDSLHLEA